MCQKPYNYGGVTLSGSLAQNWHVEQPILFRLFKRPLDILSMCKVWKKSQSPNSRIQGVNLENSKILEKISQKLGAAGRSSNFGTKVGPKPHYRENGGGQRPPTKFGTWVEPPGLHFRAKARQDRAIHFGAINDEYMPRRRKMAIFASLNPHISGGGQPTPTKLGMSVETPRLQFHAKAK